MLYQICNGVVQFAADTILEEINFEIRDTEKIAVVGRNGSGKTTLLKLIAGEIELAKRDSDEDMYIAKAGKPVIGYLKQMTFEDNTITLEKEVRKVFAEIESMQAKMEDLRRQMEQDPTEKNVKTYTDYQERFNYIGGYYYEKEYETVIRKFGFSEEDKKKSLSEFSGGQRTKIAFMKLLLSKPDILLLDEPTNHLDIDTIEWLEAYLKSYDRAVVIVSHDRMFLDRIVDVVYEIEYKTPTRYPGNYTHFLEEKKKNWEKLSKDFSLQQKEIARLNAIVERFKNKPTKVAMTKSKLKAIEHMDKIEAPARYDLKTFHANFEPTRDSVKDVLSISQLAIGYDRILATISLELKKGEKIGIIGGNGIGKSTFLKTLVGMIPALGGTFTMGAQVDLGYFDQQMAQYSSEKTVVEDFWEVYPNLMQNEVRSALGAFLFSQDEVFKTVSMLSGGERVRLALCKLFKTKPNFLILDEPTNHMDIVGKETLEAMLKGYPGSLLFVSHDRYFVNQVATKLLIFDDNQVTFYPYGYEDYLEKTGRNQDVKGEISVKKFPENKNGGIESRSGEMDNETGAGSKNYFNPGKEKAKKERFLQKIEDQISACEQEIQRLKDELLRPEFSTAYTRLTQIQDEIDQNEEKLLDLMQQWEDAGNQVL